VLVLLSSACAGPALRTSDPADDPVAPGLPSAPETTQSSGSSGSPPASDSADPQDAHHAPPATTASASAAEPEATAPPAVAPTDAQIVRDLERALASNTALSSAAKRVKVSCRDGKVVLSGTVATLTERTAVENAAQQVGGVRQIDSRLVIEK
jgi:hypothetical protein